MRDYLYIWNQPDENFFVASGIEFKDFIPSLSNRGIILIEHNADDCDYDSDTSFEYIPNSRVNELNFEDIYDWGNFSWVDYLGNSISNLSKNDVAEILYFGHTKKALNDTSIKNITNKFLVYAHDDGWFIKVYYSNWRDVWDLICSIHPLIETNNIENQLKSGDDGFWIKNNVIEKEEKTYDIDSILNRRL